MQSGFALFAVMSWLALTTGLAPRPVGAEPMHGFAIHGDLKYPETFGHFDYANPEAPKGGTLRVATIGSYDSFNPFIVKGAAAAGVTWMFQSYLYDALMVRSRDEPASDYGLLAESVEIPADGRWAEFKLRPEARWHDGKPITVEDVIWTFDTLMEHGSPVYRGYYGNVDRVEKTAPNSVRFFFKPGENRELPGILGEMPILPKHYWADHEFDATTLDPPLGSGAYEIGEFEAGRFVTWKRRDDYWAKNLPVNRGLYNFDVVRIDYYRDTDVAIEALKSGAYDYRRENSAKNWSTAYDTAAVREKRLIRAEIPTKSGTGAQGYQYNLRRDVFKDRRVREALGYAFDFEWSRQTLFYGLYERTSSNFENSELAARGLPSAAELEILEPYRGRIPDEVFTQVYAPPVTDGSGNIRENLKTAVRLLDEAGWSIRDGVMTNRESGEPLAFEILLMSPADERVALPFKKNLERIGVQASVRTVDVAQYRRRLDTFDFDMTSLPRGQSDSPGNEQREFWKSEYADQEGSRNWNGIQDPVVDELVELVVSAPDRESLVVRTRALDRVLLWGYYMIPQFYSASDRVLYWDRFGMPDVLPNRGVAVDAWWIDEKKDAALRAARGKNGN